ncbi:MAG TPA: Gfo/Idh/MocA family oxidoreductase [Pirellulaceae bacterium]|jgi:predicted dehydrogenase|nr:Gfo/Idh/MocA family oxidoreductase [Pirellulaceae bacterium]
MARQIDRRQFVGGAVAAAGAGYWLASQPGLTLAQSPNQKVNVACIGVGGKGSSDTDDSAKYGQIVALCDVDDQRLQQKAKQYPDAKLFHDFRELLSVLGDKVDAVTVSTADHTHAAAAVRAMRLGKHVYCQKPLTHTVAEARLMRETARKQGVVTQMGNQGTAHDGFRAGVELIQSGAIGPIREVHVWTNRPYSDWAAGKMYWKQAPQITARPTETPPVPDHLSWDLWVGPAPLRPYNPAYHPHDWRGWWDFGTGALGDMACHTANLPFMALGLGLPTRVSAVSSKVNPETYPAWATITYEFPSRDDQPPVKLVWYEGSENGKRNLPKLEFPGTKEPTDSGSLFIGEKGRLYSPGDSGDQQVVEVSGQVKTPEQSLERLGLDRGPDENQKREWLRAIQGGSKPLSNFDYASVLTEAMLLGNVAVRLGEPIEYDGEKGQVTSHPDAVSLIDPAPRQGWEL